MAVVFAGGRNGPLTVDTLQGVPLDGRDHRDVVFRVLVGDTEARSDRNAGGRFARIVAAVDSGQRGGKDEVGCKV